MTKEFQTREKFFWVSPHLGIEWPYADRRAIGVNLSDFYGLKDSVWTFVVEGKTYKIGSIKAKELGKKFVLKGKWPMPNLLPLEEFKKLYDENIEEKPVTSMQLGFQI